MARAKKRKYPARFWKEIEITTGATRTKEADEVTDAIEALGFNLEDSQGEWSWVRSVPDVPGADYALVVMEHEELAGPPLKWDDEVSVRLFHHAEIEEEWEAAFPNVRKFLEAVDAGWPDPGYRIAVQQAQSRRAEEVAEYRSSLEKSASGPTTNPEPSAKKLKARLLR